MVTSSATGMMEGAVRQLTHKRCISFVNGAFSKRWFQIAKACGLEADSVDVEWGKAIKPEMLEEKFKTGKYDCATIVFNETSTGIMSPLEDLAEVWKKYPDITILVDAVSAMGGIKIEFEKLGVDVLLAGLQKCFALPSGLTICAVSGKALEKSKLAKGKGYYFDLVEFQKSHEKSQTPTTPAIPHLFGLDHQLTYILDVEGLENRWARHKELATAVQDWAIDRGFGINAEARKYSSYTLTTVNNREKKVDISALNKELKKHWAMIGNGYKELKDITFRIAHMGDVTMIDILGLLAVIDRILKLK
jgi:aspartate aminotransferase-like enzyme